MPLFTAIGVATAAGIGLTTAGVATGVAGAVLTSGVALTTAGTIVAGTVAFGLQAAVGLGVNQLIKKTAGRNTDPSADALTGPGFSVQTKLGGGGRFPRSFPLGWRATAGSLVWGNTYKYQLGTGAPNGYLTRVIALSCLPLKRVVPDGEETHPIYALKALWIAGKKVTINYDDEDVDRGFPIVEYTDDNPVCWIKFYDGTQTEADPLCVNKAASASRPYPSTRVGKGMAYAVITMRTSTKYWTSGVPDLLFELHGIPLYDPSKDTSVGGEGPQRWADRSTWGGDGDHLPAVQLYNLLRGITYEGRWIYGMQAMGAARLPVAHWIEQINKCREEVDNPDGETTEPRYRSSLEIFVNNEFGTTVEALLTACQGRLSESGGYYKLFCGAPDDTGVLPFTDNDIIATEAQTFTPFFGLDETVNGVTATYPSPEDGWNDKAAPPLYDEDLEEEAGGRRLPADVKLDMVPYDSQVQRLMKESLAEAQRAKRLTITLGPKWLQAEPGDILPWTSVSNGWTNKLFRIDGMLDRSNLCVTLDLCEVDPSDYNYSAPDDFVQPSVGAPSWIPVEAVQPGGFDATPDTVTDDSGDSERPVIYVEWSTVEIPDVEAVQIEITRVDNAEVVVSTRVDQVDLGAIPISANILPNTEYSVQIKHIAPLRETLWSDPVVVTTPEIYLNFSDLNPGVRDFLQRYLPREVQRLRDVAREIAANAHDQDTSNYLQQQKIKQTMMVENGNLRASITTAQEVAITHANEAVAALSTEINSNLAENYATVTELAATYASLESLEAFYGVELDINGYASGFRLYNAGAGTDFFQIIASKFQIAQPSVTGGDPKTIFEVANVGGTPTVTIKGNVLSDGIIVAAKISAGAIETDKLAANAVTTGKLAAGAVTANEIGANAVTAVKIQASAVETDKLAANAVTAAKIAANAVETDKLNANAVTAAKIAAGAIETDKLAANAVTAAKIAANTITANEIAANAVTASEIAANAVETDKLNANAVTTGKLAAGAVTANEIAANAVTAGKILAGEIGTNHLAALAVTTAKIAAGAITANELAANAVTANKILAGEVGANHLASNSVTTVKLDALAVTTAKLDALAVTTAKLAAGSVTASKLVVGSYMANLCVNGDFEDDLNNWTDSSSAGGSISIQTSNQRAGGKCLRLTRTADASNSSSAIVTGSVFPVTEGVKYRASCWAKANTASDAGFYLRVYWLDSSQSFISTSDPFFNTGLTTTYTQKSGIVTAPANARYAFVQLWNHGPDGSDAQYYYIDDVEMRQAVGSTIIEDNSITTGKLVVDSIETQHIKSEAATAFWNATGADNSDYKPYPSQTTYANAKAVGITATLVNGNIGLTFTVQPEFRRNGSDSFIVFSLYIDSVLHSDYQFWCYNLSAESVIRHPLIIDIRLTGLSAGSHTFDIVLTGSNYNGSGNWRRIWRPTMKILESRR